MKQSILVFGGSFNPPTIAHWQIMREALDQMDARKGFLVPVSYAYLKRKMRKQGQSHLCLGDELRLQMLEAMVRLDSRMEIWPLEMKETFAVTLRTMSQIQERVPDARLHFILGEDKLDLLAEFQRKGEFLDHYGAIVFSREGEERTDPLSHPLFSSHGEAMTLLKLPAGIQKVSSTKIREHLFDLEPVASMLHPAVIPILKGLKAEDYPEEILTFKEEEAFLSNDYPCEVVYEGIPYASAASAFLASKYENAKDRERIAGMSLPKAKQKAGSFPGSKKWQEKRVSVMEDIVREKFRQHPDLMERLLGTGLCRLIDGGRKDSFWGVNLITWEGENHLGKLLMKIREEERKGV